MAWVKKFISKNITQSVACFKFAIISPLCSSHDYLNRHVFLNLKMKIWNEKHNNVKPEGTLFTINEVTVS